MGIFCNNKKLSHVIDIEKENRKARKTMIELDNGTTAYIRFGLVEICNFDHKIREMCPSCRRETVIDFKKKIMTCDNKKCKYFDKSISSIVMQRKRRIE